MIFWVFVILTIVSIAVLIATNVIGNNYNNKFAVFVYDNEGIICFGFGIILVISALITAIMFCGIIVNQVSASGNKAKLEQTYNALIYKSQTESIRDEFGIVNKEYIDEVQMWNENVAQLKEWSNDFWVGIFYPKKIYEDLEIIDLTDIKMRE